jgi:methylglyoxal synthase
LEIPFQCEKYVYKKTIINLSVKITSHLFSYELLILDKIKKISMEKIKQIALVAHDNRKKDLIEWVEWNWEILRQHKITCTGTTGKLVEQALQNKADEKEKKKINIRKLKSGPLGGDQQLGALITEGEVDIIIFFWDPMQPQPHDVDVKALLRISVLYNVPTACNRSTADFIISSALFNEPYIQKIKNYDEYIGRSLEE